MKQRNVLAMVVPMSMERVNGIARYAREHGWNLLIQDSLGSKSSSKQQTVQSPQSPQEPATAHPPI